MIADTEKTIMIISNRMIFSLRIKYAIMTVTNGYMLETIEITVKSKYFVVPKRIV